MKDLKNKKIITIPEVDSNEIYLYELNIIYKELAITIIYYSVYIISK